MAKRAKQTPSFDDLTDDHGAEPDFDSALNHQMNKGAGLAMLIAGGLGLTALATWSIDDPSFTHATSKPVENWIGFPGAALSDLLFQLVGLAGVLLLLPLVIWGLKILFGLSEAVHRKQVISWLPAFLFAAALAATIKTPESWPLPTGLGGVLGDAILMLPQWLTGRETSGIFGLLLGLVFALPLFFFLQRMFIDRKAAQPEPNAEQAPSRRATVHRQPAYSDDEEEHQSGFDVGSLLGAGAHYSLIAGANLKRMLGFSSVNDRENPAAYDTYDLEGDAHETKANWRASLSRLASLKEKLVGNDDYDDGLDTYLEPQYEAQPRIGTRTAPEVGMQRAPHPHQAEFRAAEPQPQAHHQAEPPLYDAPPADSYPENYAQDYDAPYEDTIDYGDDSYEMDAPSTETFEPMAAPVAPKPKSSLQPRAAQTMRVAPKKAAPKQSTRSVREAQTSMLRKEGFDLPGIHFLDEPKAAKHNPSLSNEVLSENAQMLETVLDDFGIKGEIIHVRPGPVVTLYELEPAPGIKSSRVIGLADDIARSMSAIAARVAVIPGKNAIGIELPNDTRETVYLREMIGSQIYEKSKGKLPLALGKTIGGEPVIADLARMPHLLVAGTTGSGKSVAINTMILSLLYRMTPEQCRLIMIDPKMLELSIYDGIPHLLTPVVTDPKKAVVALKWTVREMEDRYKKMSKVGVRNIDGFNMRVKQASDKGEPIVRTVQTGYDQETGEAIYEREELDMQPMPYIVVIIDEMADLMMVAGKDIEGTVQRLAQMARAAGIHVIMATQRPSVDVITGTIKANFPTRISFQVTSKIDSRTILGEQGAEQLLGMGDMLFMPGGGKIQRVHGPFVSDDEVEGIVRHLKDQGVPEYLESITEEDEENVAEGADGAAGGLAESTDLYDQAVAIVLRDKKASTSYIQRRLSIGYNRAASIIERMEQEGVVGPANHAGKREILVGSDPDEDFGGV